ncbi:MAG TPA: DUF3175 domain-containing protein [Opitutaceae bacterium]|jgi:hypothetical protein
MKTRSARKSAHRAPRSSGRKWSARVTRTSNAPDLKRGAFKSASPRSIAKSVERAAKASRRRKPGSYRSAMSMISFYENRAGKNLPPAKRKTLQRAKAKVRRDLGR